MLVINGDDIRGILRMRRTVEAEPFSGREVVIGGNFALEIDSGGILTHLLRLREHRQPQEHLDIVRVQILAYALVNVFVQTPADDDLFDRNQCLDFTDAADNLLRRVIGGIPSAQRYLDDIAGVRGLVLAGHHSQQGQDNQ